MKNEENYLLKKPYLKKSISYKCDANGIVTLEIENKGIMNKICQRLFKKPKTSFIHLDETGSYAILNADGERDIVKIGIMVKEKFGEKAEPLYERLAEFFRILDSYSFIDWNGDVIKNEKD